VTGVRGNSFEKSSGKKSMVSLFIRPLSVFEIPAQEEDVPVKGQVVSHSLSAASDFGAGSGGSPYIHTDKDTRYFFPYGIKGLIE
jgi:hypothetical protein